jgi:hypothetical protein
MIRNARTTLLGFGAMAADLANGPVAPAKQDAHRTPSKQASDALYPTVRSMAAVLVAEVRLDHPAYHPTVRDMAAATVPDPDPWLELSMPFAPLEPNGAHVKPSRTASEYTLVSPTFVPAPRRESSIPPRKMPSSMRVALTGPVEMPSSRRPAALVTEGFAPEPKSGTRTRALVEEVAAPARRDYRREEE